MSNLNVTEPEGAPHAPRSRDPARGGLTKKQRELLAFLRSYIAENDGIAPSYDEMAVAINLKSKSGLHELLDALDERGFIKRIPNRARAIFLVEGSPSEFERGRSTGYAEGYMAAAKKYRHQEFCHQQVTEGNRPPNPVA